MARMSCAVANPTPQLRALELALVPIEGAAEPPAWSIDSEAMGSGWHESSWLLRRGLQVDENPPPDAIPPEWQWRWWIASQANA